uniref:Enoyl-CoA hydratase/isomerase n=1 Tax=Streptomyces violaceoruber TaxID=1935 RepID=C0Z470_STRVN|nr:enoyl-CoA hydratase/isomerase [Streptomyces violaceoruber]
MSSVDSVAAPAHRPGVHLEVPGSRPLTPELVAAVQEVCDRAEELGDEPVVVHLGGGPDDGTPPATDGVAVHLVNKWERALRRLERLETATVAVVSGDCSGPAVEVLLSCDYRIAGPDLRLTLPFWAGEPWPGMLVYRLANQLGVARARSLVLFGTALSAQRAAEVGLVDEVTETVAAVTAERLARARDFAGTELAIRRRLLLDAAATSFEDALGTHLAACDRALRRSDRTAVREAPAR